MRISVVALLNPHITDIHYAPMSADVHLFLTTLNAQKELKEYYVIVEKARLYQDFFPTHADCFTAMHF